MKTIMKRRFTAEEDDIIRTDYADYVDVRATATNLNRDWATVRQRVYMLGIKRDSRVSKMLKWCPEHLKHVLKEKGSVAFIEAVNNHTDKLGQNESDEEATLAAHIAEIESKPWLTRKEKMLAMRALGMTQESIGERFGVSRERVRQLTDPDFTRPPKTERIVEKLLSVNTRLEAKIASNKQRIKVKALDTLKSCWDHLDEDARAAFLNHVNTKQETQQ